MVVRKSDDPRRKNRPWYCTYRDQHRKQHRLYFRLEREAKAYEREVSGEVERGTHAPKWRSGTVAEACGLWLQQCELNKLASGTLQGYRDYVRRHIVPGIGGEKLALLKRTKVDNFVDDVTRSVSQKTARRVLYALRNILTVAQQKGLLAQNVATDVKVPTPRKRDEPKVGITLKVPTPKEAARLIAGARPAFRPMVMTALFTGMRWAELRALTWDDVDLERNVIIVREAKTAAGVREIPMSPELAKTLREWRFVCPRAGGLTNLRTYEAKALQIERLIKAGRTQRQITKELHVQQSAVVAVRRAMRDGTEPPSFARSAQARNLHRRHLTDGQRALVAAELAPLTPTGRLKYVFPTRLGGKRCAGSTTWEFRELQRAIGMVDGSGKPKFVPHRTRHWFASWGIKQGWPAKHLQAYLGHATISETFDTYGHLFSDPEGDRERFARSDAAFRDLAGLVTKWG
jgi:integrase